MKGDNFNYFESSYVKSLFEEMSATYGVMNLISSFGFTAIWRAFCVNQLTDKDTRSVCDLMSGMGELIPHLLKRYPRCNQVVAIDFCPSMCSQIRLLYGSKMASLKVLEEDVFQIDIPTNSFDCVVSSFGLKTFSPEQQVKLAELVARILKPGGCFSFVEISFSPHLPLKVFTTVYVTYVVPFIGRIFLGNPSNYRMLGVYVRKFNNAKYFMAALEAQGLECRYTSHFLGSATGVTGRKTAEAAQAG
jgi:ubiquinone/menaquinone biosynthesis methyltransferase